MNELLVSIIVPMYNVEKYIEKCIESILAQDHKNIELILVDDGSPDQSGLIADRYASTDTRVIVVHQSNSGVSVARNAGLDRARGTYVCFVDGDDWITNQFVSVMLGLALKTDSDFVLSTNVLSDKLKAANLEPDYVLWTPAHATARLLYPEIPLGSWNKLYKRSLLDSHAIRFLPRFFMGEGLNFITMFAQVSNKAVATAEPLYFYRKDNMESATTKIDVEKMKNALLAIEHVRNRLLIDSEEIVLALDYHQWMTCFYSLYAIAVTNSKSVNKDFYSISYEFVKKNSLRMVLKADISLKQKIKAAFIWVSPTLMVRYLIERRKV